MTGWVALLRAVNVGGMKVLMEDLRALAKAEGFAGARTYIASGNLVLSSALDEAAIRERLEGALERRYGKRVPVLVRSAAEMADVAARNPFADAPGNRVVAIFCDGPIETDGIRGDVNGEVVEAGEREFFVHYPNMQGNSKLAIPAAKHGTARNMNTVAKLAAMAAEA